MLVYENDAALTDTQREVSAIVRAGSQNTVVRVVASVEEDGRVLETTSAPIAINSNVPHHAGFSLSASNFTPNAWRHDGVPVSIVIRASDLSGNVIRGGTIVGFTATHGAIEGDCELDANGRCAVSWRSQGQRPPDGRVIILARSVGDESSEDLSSNGVFDAGEGLLITGGERGEAFYDQNRNGSRELTEQYFDDSGNGVLDGPSGTYDGSACKTAVSGCPAGPVTVWEETYLTMASDEDIAISITARNGQYCAVASGDADNRPKPMPTGTEFIFTVSQGGDITSTPTSFSVPNNDSRASESGPFCVEAEGAGELSVTVVPPEPFDGAGTQASIALQ